MHFSMMLFPGGAVDVKQGRSCYSNSMEESPKSTPLTSSEIVKSKDDNHEV